MTVADKTAKPSGPTAAGKDTAERVGITPARAMALFFASAIAWAGILAAIAWYLTGDSGADG
jgi:hypothetical protein